MTSAVVSGTRVAVVAELAALHAGHGSRVAVVAELAALDVGHVGHIAQEHDMRRSKPGSRW